MVNRKRWFCLAIGTILLMFCGLLYGWSLFKIPLSVLYPTWSLAQLSVTFTLSMAAIPLSSFAAGKLSAFFKPRAIMMMSATLILLGFTGVSRLDPADPAGSLWLLYLCYGAIASSGIGFSYNSIISTVSKWFPDRQGLASGVMMMGYGMGGLVLGGIASALVERVGILHTFLILGMGISGAVFAGSFVIRNPGERDSVPQSADALLRKSMTTREMLHCNSFWVFVCWGFTVNTAGLMIINSAAPIAVAFGAPAIAGMIVSAFNGVGRFTIGALFDRIGRKRTMLVNTIVLATAGVSLLVGAKTQAAALILLGLVGMGFSYGGNPIACIAFANKQFGPKYFAVNFSLMNFSVIPAAVIGPLLSSALIERGNGTYVTTFAAVAIIAAVAFVLWALLNRACDRAGEDE